MRSERGLETVLGVATGRTPRGVYGEWIRMRRDGRPFRNVRTVNLDELWPTERGDSRSFRAWMDRALFRPLGLDRTRTSVPDGSVPRAGVRGECAAYERSIRRAGGIDLQILGIGRNGHVGFNEPGSSVRSRTRLVRLAPSTRRALARDFGSSARSLARLRTRSHAVGVPRFALTMGVATILEARAIVAMAFGREKASIVRRALEGPITPRVPASFLRLHPRTLFVLDQAAAARLRRGGARRPPRGGG
jgi:glucosamine-6-phosphate deaminase